MSRSNDDYAGVAGESFGGSGGVFGKSNVRGAGEGGRADAIDLPMRVALHQFPAKQFDEFGHCHVILHGKSNRFGAYPSGAEAQAYFAAVCATTEVMP